LFTLGEGLAALQAEAQIGLVVVFALNLLRIDALLLYGGGA